MLSFADATGNLFNRIGRCGKLVEAMRQYQDDQLYNMTDTTDGVVAQYDAESDLQAQIGSSYIGQLNSAANVGFLAQNLAITTLNRMIFRDDPRISQNLVNLNIEQSLEVLIQQMILSDASVLKMVVTGTAAEFQGIGNGVVNVSIYRPSDGRTQENAFAENVQLVCTADSYTATATEGNEPFSVQGTGSEPNLFAFDWPLGSNASTTLNAIDGNVDVGSGNYLTNSGFEEWDSNTPDNWVIEIGTAGTNVFENNGQVYDGDAALQITGDASGTLTTLVQEFGSSDGTLAVLSPFTQYGVNIFVRRDGVAPAAGVVTVDLVDENDDVLLDEAGNPNEYTIDCTTLSTEYQSFTGAFRTPHVMPETLYVRIRLSTALTDGRSIYLDKMSMGLMTQLYLAGPYFSVHAGAVPFAIGDYAVATITNSRGAGGSLDTFQTLFARFFTQMFSSEFLLPSSATPTISDDLITR